MISFVLKDWIDLLFNQLINLRKPSMSFIGTAFNFQPNSLEYSIFSSAMCMDVVIIAIIYSSIQV